MSRAGDFHKNHPVPRKASKIFELQFLCMCQVQGSQKMGNLPFNFASLSNPCGQLKTELFGINWCLRILLRSLEKPAKQEANNHNFSDFISNISHYMKLSCYSSASQKLHTSALAATILFASAYKKSISCLQHLTSK